MVDTSPPPPQIEIHRYVVEQLDDGRWQATPEYDITPEMEAAGCKAVLYAGTPDELRSACYWERIRAANAARAAGVPGW